jgi:hypothetical protein
MLHVSRFEPDPERFGEWIAGLWQGPVPPDLVLHRWIYLTDEPRRVLLVWEGGAAAEEYVADRFGAFGTLSTEVGTDATPGLAACFARDLEGFGAWLRADRGGSDEEIAAQLDLRRRGLVAPTFAEAREAGKAWQAGRTS